MLNKLSVLVTVLSLPCLNGQALESIPSTAVVKKPGETLSLSCRGSGFTFGSYGMHWIRQPAGKGLEWMGAIWYDASKTVYASNVQGRIEITRDNSNSMTYLKLSNLRPEDSAVYYCVRANGNAFDYWGKGTTVTVTSATSTAPTVFPLVPCGSGTGDKVTLACLATGFTPSTLTFSWTKDGTVLTDFIQYPPVLKNDVYTGISQIQVNKADWTSENPLKCSVTHVGGDANGVLLPPSPKITQLPTLVGGSSSGTSEDEVTFSCFAKDFAPNKYEIKWHRSDNKNDHKVYGNKEGYVSKKDVNGTLYNAASFLTVKTEGLEHETEFMCIFEGKNEKGEDDSKNVTVTYNEKCDAGTTPTRATDLVDIKIIEPTMQDILTNKRGTVTCQVTQIKPTIEKIVWQNAQGKELVTKENPFPNGAKKTYNISVDITFNEWSRGVKFYCLIEHKEWYERIKLEYERIPGAVFDRPSVFMLPPVEHAKKERVTLTCYVKDFKPRELFVSWLVDDEAADSRYNYSSTESSVESDGSFFAYSHLTLSLEQWKESGVVYSCAVYHESLVNTTNTIVRSIGYNTLDKTNLVNLDLNIPQTCNAQ